MRRLRLLVVAVAIALPACAHTTTPAPIVMPEAPLGRVIIYRNGVAYYERNAIVDGELSLKVPRARVDDFLKSLSVVDLESGKPLAISYPTTPGGVDRFVEMNIELPKGRRRVKITYVTESPAWKPSYRVMLGAAGKSRLQSWAVVDNVSGEAWDNVQVGVGSTSALSFRYDLHSVRVVERETIDHGTKMAVAPPTGGSPYVIDGKEQRLLANVSDFDLEAGARVAVKSDQWGADEAALGLGGAGAVGGVAAGKTGGAGRGNGVKLPASRSKGVATTRNHAQKPADSALDRLAGQLHSNQERVRLEGYAIAGESEGQDDGLRRANTLREQLVNRGISPDRIDVVAGTTPVADATEAIRVVAVDKDAAATQAVADGGQDGAPRGTAHFVSDGPISLDAGRSAMVTLLDEPTAAQRVYLYDPISSRGSARFAFNAIRLDNPSDHTLDPGPVTVYAEQQFLGEGLTEPIPPHATALVPYALDRSLRVTTGVGTKEEIQRLVAVERGIATTQTRRTRSTTFELDNRGTDAATIYVRHRVASGWTLADPPDDLEQLGDDVLIPVRVEAGKRTKLVLDETMPITTAIDLRSTPGFRAVEVYLSAHEVAPELKVKLDKILTAHRRLHDIEDQLITRNEQMDVLRERVTELNIQLVTLRKVNKAQSLSGHLAKRMSEISDKLDDATLTVTELQTNRLTTRIELADLVAELTLEDAKAAGGNAIAAPTP